MKTITSVKSLAGQGDVTLVIGVPSFEEVIAHYGGSTELFVENWVGHKVANDLATRVKGAFTKVFENSKEPDASKHKALTERDKEIVALVNAGETLALLDFVGRPREAKPDEYQELIRSKWAGSDKKAGFLARLGLDAGLVSASAQEVEAAYLAKRDELTDML